MNNKEFVVHLIREELRNKCLMYSLRDLGFDCSSYTLNISQEILDLVGFQEKSNELYQWYFKLIDKLDTPDKISSLRRSKLTTFCRPKWSVSAGAN